jgi:plasmid stabilization system protein ParE
MDFKVIFTETFLDDLGRIVRLIAADNRAAGQKLGQLLIHRCESLSFFPERHPRVRQRPELRRFVVRKYFKIFYRVRYKPPIVEVLRCWDARQEEGPEITG